MLKRLLDNVAPNSIFNCDVESLCRSEDSIGRQLIIQKAAYQ